MGQIATSERQITLYYSSDSKRAKQTLAYAHAEGIALQAIDILKTPLTGTQIAEIAQRLNMPIENLVNQNHPSYSSKFKPQEFSDHDWIKVIRNHPNILKQPIAIRGDVTILIETPTDIIKI
ncbi:hypothetical protein [Ascidiimonas aurantiaca]|uniref:arsenate reductase family protein n=1 Tax=Ascidiimonas aurantiaca TaxID=1685432 RepID=UPI0030EE61F7